MADQSSWYMVGNSWICISKKVLSHLVRPDRGSPRLTTRPLSRREEKERPGGRYHGGRWLTTVFTVQPSFHHRHSTNRVSWSVTSSSNDEVRCDCTFTDDGYASWFSVCRVPMMEWRLDCENCRHLTVVGLQTQVAFIFFLFIYLYFFTWKQSCYPKPEKRWRGPVDDIYSSSSIGS